MFVVNDAWQRYYNFWQHNNLRNLTLEQLREACPHINDLDFHVLTHYQPITAMAFPPLRVRGRYKVAVLIRHEYGYELQWTASAKANTSFAFAANARAYAEHMWSEKLVADTWSDVQRIHLCDPIQPNRGGEPGHITTIYITLSRQWSSIIADQEVKGHKSLLPSWNKAIEQATTVHAEGEEFAGTAHQAFTHFCCALCGGGLALEACSGCGFNYKPLSDGWSIPLPPKLVSLLEAEGHQFTLQPSRLWS